MSLAERFLVDLQLGLTVPAASSKEGISVGLGEVILDDLLRRGVVTNAASLCSSGSKGCGEGPGCIGCPLATRRSPASVTVQ